VEIRRIQMTGGSSYIITLPKEWIKASNIKKNDPIGLLVQSDGTLLITSRIKEEQLYKLKEFDTSKIPKHTFLLRQLIGAYIAGYTSIIVKSPSRMPTDVRNILRIFTQTTIGQEIVEETDSSVTLKDLLNPIEMPLDRTIKRMQIIVKGMNEDTLRAIKTNDTKLAHEIILRDTEVDRLHWLIARQYHMILQNVSLAEKMNITIDLSSTYFLISRIIERIGDHIVRIAQNIQHLNINIHNQKILDKIEIADNLALDIFIRSMGAFFRKDIKSSNENIDTVEKLEKLCEEINTLALQQKVIVAISIGYIADSIRRIGEYAEDISETVINYLINEEK
jgi:phosphate uptake regulator